MRLSREAQIQLSLVIASFGLAWVWPVPTLLWSYAILGPAHYLTELEWLRQKGWYMQGSQSRRGAWAVALTILTAVGCAFPRFWPLCVLIALPVCVAAAMTASLTDQLAAGALGLLGLAAMATKIPSTWLVLAIWLPTILHVGLFTAAFIARGAIRAKDASFAWVLVAIALGILACAFSSGTALAPPNAVSGLVHELPARLSTKGAYRLLALIYLFHYLNWGSKTRLLGWRRGAAQLWVLGTLWAVSVGLYLWRYEVGLRAQLFLSLLHVVLELPLNATTFRELGQAFVGALTRFPLRERRAA